MMKPLLLLLLFQQTPEEFFGHPVGADRKLVPYGRIVEYLRHLESESGWIRVREVGRTTRDRPLVMAVVSTPENLAMAGEYRKIAKSLAAGSPDAEDQARELSRKGKVILSVTNNLHSTEIAASQTAAEFAYECALGKIDLGNVILLLFPSINPDGQEMVVDWYAKHAGTETEGGPMPWLYHPYAGHDNNRDWFAMNLVETRAVSRVYYRDWLPQIVVDHHQMGSTGARIWVPPYTNPSNKNVHPMIWRWQNVFGTHLAKDLEAAGCTGVQSEWIFDSYWPGAADSNVWWFNRIGILTESASCRVATPIWVDPSEASEKQANVLMPSPWKGGWWRLRDIVDQQLAATKSIVETASRNRERILMDSWRMARDHPVADFAGYFLPAKQQDPAALGRLLEILDLASVSIRKTDGGYYVPLAQPAGRYVRDLFSVQKYSDSARLYDVAGWTLPLQMGVTFSESAERKGEPASAPFHLPESPGSTEIALRINRMLAEGKPVHRGPDGRFVTEGEAWEIRPPRLGIYQPWTGSMDEGWTRLVLDRFEFRYEVLHNDRMKKGELRKDFDCLLLPSVGPEIIRDGRRKEDKNKPQLLPPEYQGGIGKEGVEALKKFVEEGGTLVALASACDFAIAEWGLPVRNTLKDDKKFSCPGSILKCRVDTAHPLGWGMPEDAHLFLSGGPALQTSPPRRADIRRHVVVRYDEEENPLASGLLNQPEKLRGRSALVEVLLGEGRIVLFGFRPQHRAQTWGTFKLLFNAIFLSASRKTELRK